MRGEICFVVKDRNFGFIRSNDNQKLFFHYSEIKFHGDVKPGIRVEFEYGRNKKGVTAVNIIRQRRKKPQRWDNLISFIENAKIDEESRKILLRNLAQFRQQQLHILIAGPTGVGKSSTINALFDAEVAEVGYGVDTMTKCIQEWKLDENLILHDTPGLGDGPAQDLLYKQMIKNELGKKNPDGSALIDVALVIIDGSHRDMGTSIELINETIIPNMEDKSRILVAINRCDMANDGKGWNKRGNYPDKNLVQRLNEKTKSVQCRIKESTGVDIQPIYYSALYKYNISKLLSFIIKCTPIKKRFFYIDNLNSDEQVWKDNDISDQNYSRSEHDGYVDLSNEVSDLNRSVKRMKKTYQRDMSDLQNSVINMKKMYQQESSDLQDSVINMKKMYQQESSDLQNSVINMKKMYQQESAEMISDALKEVSKEISKGSKTPINLSFNEMIKNVSNGISAGAQAGENIGKIIPVLGKGVGKIVGGIFGGVGGLLKSVFR